MERKRIYRILSFFSFAIGFFLVNFEGNITGAVVGASVSSSMLNPFVGIILIFVSGVLFITGGGLEKKVISSNKELELNRKKGTLEKMGVGKRYFHKRALELTKDPEHDAWVSQWEVDALKKEFKEMGFKVIRGPESHYGGITGPYQRHLNITGKNKYEQKVNKHILITYDPCDKRLYRTGFFNSKVYHPKHPREREYIFKK